MSFLNQYNISIAFLSEPQLFQCDAKLYLTPISNKYCYLLNSEDKFQPDLPMEKNKAWGGTLALWRKELDPFVYPLESSNPGILPILLKVPGVSPSIHIGVYLPT